MAARPYPFTAKRHTFPYTGNRAELTEREAPDPKENGWKDCHRLAEMVRYSGREEVRMGLMRFSVSLEEGLLRQFDAKIRNDRCPTRSKAVGDLIRANLVETEWRAGEEVAGAVVLVYDHHTRNVVEKLTEAQHDCHAAIISTQHVHLDHDNCLEIIAVRGRSAVIDRLVARLKAVKGLKHVSVAAGTTGARLP